MKIQDALKETGKAVFPREVGVYAEITFDRGANFLSWVDIESKTHEGIVAYETHFSDAWLPYHEEKEIKPEKAGELWESPNGCLWFSYLDATYGGKVRLIPHTTGFSVDIDYGFETEKGVIHGKEGWTRKYPPVEGEGVDTYELEGVIFLEDDGVIFPTSTHGQFSNGNFDRFVSKPPMKMILEIPKDSK